MSAAEEPAKMGRSKMSRSGTHRSRLAGWQQEPLPFLTEDELQTALRDCFDPEVKLNLVDLGLIYAIATEPDPDATLAVPRQRVKVTMTLTTPQCPASGLIFEQVNNRLLSLPQVSKVEVDLVWEPRWTPHRISTAGRAQLGL